MRTRSGCVTALANSMSSRRMSVAATPSSTARAQTGARHLLAFREACLTKYRVELLDESGSEAHQIIQTYQGLLEGEIDGEAVWRRLGAESKLGVTEGTLLG